jgi:hypothetical protein
MRGQTLSRIPRKLEISDHADESNVFPFHSHLHAEELPLKKKTSHFELSAISRPEPLV